jgi:hypothetical protein
MNGDAVVQCSDVMLALLRQQDLVETLRSNDQDALRRERSSKQRPIGFDKAQNAFDRYVTDTFLDKRDLLMYAVDQRGAVSVSHHEFLDARPQDPALNLEFGPSLVPLSVDHQIPPGVMAMWSIFARDLGIRRSCRNRSDSEACLSKPAARRSSPSAPIAHAFVLCFSSDRATAMRQACPTSDESLPHRWLCAAHTHGEPTHPRHSTLLRLGPVQSLEAQG